MSRNYAYERKEQLRSEFKVQLPVPIDSKRYFYGRIAFIDVFIILPFFILSVISIFLLYKWGWLNNFTLGIAVLPVLLATPIQMTKHKVRKELNWTKYVLLWKYQYYKREKTFFYRKGEFDVSDKQDARKKIGIKSVFADCYVTHENRFVRVFEVSSVNLSLTNKSEKKSVLDSFKVFMTTTNYIKNIQFSQIAQPINLTRHIQFVTQKNKDEKNEAKRMLMISYKNSINNIQKSRDLVTRKRYIVISQAIGSDREKSLEQIDLNSKLLTSRVEGMRFEQSSLSVKQLNNDDLTKLMFTCVDYDSAVAVGDHILSRTKNVSDYSMGEESAKRMIETLTTQLKDKIN